MSSRDIAKAKKAQKLLGLTDQEVEELKTAAHVTYEQISYDLASKFSQLRRAALIEVILDSSHLENFGMLDIIKSSSVHEKLRLSRSAAGGYAALVAILRTEFCSAWYEVGPPVSNEECL